MIQLTDNDKAMLLGGVGEGQSQAGDIARGLNGQTNIIIQDIAVI